jgi:hypothetical protein
MKKPFPICGLVIVCGVLGMVLSCRRHQLLSMQALKGQNPHVKAENAARGMSRATTNDSFESRIYKLGITQCSAREMADLLKALYKENPDKLFQALLSLQKASRETQQKLIPLLANAVTLWPEAEGRYIFPIADTFGDLDIRAAAEWAAGYLGATGRSDLAASTLLSRSAEIAEDRALTLISELPEQSRRGAMDTLAFHLRLDDLNHLITVTRKIDPEGSSSFSRQLFQRLGMERLDETAVWLASSPEAQQINGAVSAIGQALVRAGDAKKAITWADSLSDDLVRAQAITAVYQEWAHNNPDGAIEDILNNYGGAPMLMADVFKGAAEHHGSGATSYWDTATALQNPSARAYALSSLIEPMIMTRGRTTAEAKIASLPAGSLERNVAERIFQSVLKRPEVIAQLSARTEN